MKRSEIISILRDAVQESNGDFGEYDEERAQFVLNKLEQVGMLPPRTDWFVNNRPEQMTWEEVNDYHMWEPEDGNK